MGFPRTFKLVGDRPCRGVHAFVFSMIAVMACLTAYSQEAATSPTLFLPRQPEHAVTPLDMLHEFDAQPETDYRLAEGDEIKLDVWGRPELSGKHVVGPDGKITLPYAGTLKVVDLTRSEVESASLKIWRDYYEDLKVTVSVEHYEGNRIFVLGRVAAPGVLHFDRQPTVLEAVARAGGMPTVGSSNEKPGLRRCILFRGSDKVAWIDLHSLLTGANTAFNIHLQRDDTLYLPDGDDQLVYVMGEVLRPGAINLTPNMTFMDALAQAGGPTKDGSSKIHLVRHSAGIDREIAMNQIVKNGPSPDVTLRDGDIIYVPRTGLAKVGYVMQQLSPATTYLLFATGITSFVP